MSKFQEIKRAIEKEKTAKVYASSALEQLKEQEERLIEEIKEITGEEYEGLESLERKIDILKEEIESDIMKVDAILQTKE